jgi:hypothetical protein
MLRTAAYVVAAVALIVFCIVVKHGFFDGSERTAQNEAGLPFIAPVLPPQAESARVSSALSTNPGRLANPGLGQRTHPSGLESSDHPAMAQPLPSIGTEASDPPAVIGHRFPMSVSVESRCRQALAKLGKEAPCDAWLQLLSEMAQEPRDEAWATDMEAKLRDLVMAESTPFAIRATECRASLCAMEVASTYGAFHFIPRVGSDEQLHSSLFVTAADFGFERDPTGATVTVTLAMFKRR